MKARCSAVTTVRSRLLLLLLAPVSALSFAGEEAYEVSLQHNVMMPMQPMIVVYRKSSHA